MEYVEQKSKETGLKITRGTATAFQVFEWLSIVLIAWTFISQKIESFAAEAPKLAYIIYPVGGVIILVTIVIGSLIADFLKWSQNTSLLNLFETKSIITGCVLGGLYFSIAYGFIVSEQEMIKTIGKTHFSVSKDSTKYTDDTNYILRLSEKQKSESEFKEQRQRIEKSVCAECLDIASKYAKDLSAWNRKRAKTDADRKYIANNISNIEGRRDGEIATATAKHEAAKAKKIELLELEFNTELKEVKTAVQVITGRIDSIKIKNDLDIEIREKKINAAATGTAWLTIIIQFICRILSFFNLKSLSRLNELFDENNPLLDALNTLPVIGKYFDDNFWAIRFHTNKAAKEADKIKYETQNDHNARMKIRRASKYITWLKKYNYTDNVISSLFFSIAIWNGDIDMEIQETMAMAYDDKKENPFKTVSIPIKSDKKISEKSAEIFEKEGEMPIILPKETPENDAEYFQKIISTFQMFLDDAEDSDSDKEYYKSIVNTFTLFLND